MKKSDMENTQDTLYQDLRGSMAQFDAITPEKFEAASNGTATYMELCQLLNEYGLTIEKVVFDDSRPFLNTFYADFEQGLYCEIYLQVENFEECHRPIFQELARKRMGGNEHLKQQNWSIYYTMDVPLPMQAYDFQKRVYQIEPSQVFDIWMRIYKRLDYSNGVWKTDILNYIFSHAPETEIPEPQDSGGVLVYRGIGALSQKSDTAISWSTHPGNALWFANHSGRGTQMLLGEVDPADIIAYFPGFYNENEVLVKPGTVKNIRSARMLPADEQTFIKLSAPMLKDFIALGREALHLGYPRDEESIFNVHSIHHILRVLFLSLVYFYHSGEPLRDEDKQILIYFSILHDIARKHDGADETHGDAAVDLIRKKNLRIKGVHLSKKGYKIAETIIRYHCREDNVGATAIEKIPRFSRKDRERTTRLLFICKDMDGLDRVRFNGLDYRFLRTPFAARLPLIAGCLLKENIPVFLEWETEV